MTHQRFGRNARALVRASAEPIAPPTWLLPTSAVWTVAILVSLLSAVYLGETEGWPAGFFASAVMLTIGALFVILFRRILPAVVLVGAVIAITRAASYVKQQTTEVLLHAYDLVSLLSSWSALNYFWRDHRQHALGLIAAVLATAVVACIAYRFDATRIQRRHAAGATVLFLCLACVASAAKGERRHTEFYFENVYVSFFFASWSETLEALWRGELIEAAAAHPSDPGLKVSAACELRSKPPHIILIHQESIVPPSHFPSLSYDRSLDPFFHSYDGQLRKLRVETYGGASWLTEFSVLTGLSAFSLGNLRQFAQTIMAGRVRETLPQALARCGYRNVAFHPMLRIYLSIGNFLNAIGVHQVFDAKDQGAKSATERDRFYYSSALAEMEHHFKTSSQPLFTFIETMATHGPYSYTYMPEVVVPGGADTDPAMHEYLRRLSMAGADYDFLRSELARRFPDQPFLIVRYGDHQPTATMTLLGFGEEASVEDVLRSGNPATLVTYYAVSAVRYQPPPLPRLEALDVPYVPSVILASAGLPLSDVNHERLRLMTLCNGHYHGCLEIPGFHRRLIDSGIIDAW